MPFNPKFATRDALLDHIVDECPAKCGGDPQVLADLDDATDTEIAEYVTNTHEWHRQHPTGRVGASG